MKVSHNELTGLCRRAFEGLGFPIGDCEDAADMIVWLQQHGLGGIEILRRTLDDLPARIGAGIGADIDFRPSRSFEDATVAVIDAAGHSLLGCAGAVADLACAEGRRKGLATVKVRDCRDRELILGYLPRCARRGMNLVTFWRARDPAGIVEQVVSFRAHEECPTLLRYRVGDRGGTPTRDRALTVMASPHCAPLQPFQPDPEGATLIEALGPEQFERRSRQAWEHGMEVDDATWARLKEVASRTLVEESDESRRRGAGEDAS